MVITNFDFRFVDFVEIMGNLVVFPHLNNLIRKRLVNSNFKLHVYYTKKILSMLLY